MTAHITAPLLLLTVMLKNCCAFRHRWCQLFYCTLADASSSDKRLTITVATTQLAATAGSFHGLLLWKSFAGCKAFLKIRKSTNSAFYCKNRTCTCDVFHRGCELVLWLSHAVLFQFVSSNRKPSIYKKQRTGRIHILLPKVSRTANRFLNLGTWRRLCAISRTAVPNCSGRHCWSGHFAEEKKSSCSSLSPQASHPYYNQISFSGREKKQAIHPF